MLKIQGKKDTKRGNVITAVTEWPVWDVLLDDNAPTTVVINSLLEPTIVSTEETATDTWTVTFSDGTVTPDLAKTGAVTIVSSTEDTGSNSGEWEVTLNSRGNVAGFDVETPVVGGWLVYDIDDYTVPSTNFTPVWEYVSAVEFAKYLVVQGG